MVKDITICVGTIGQGIWRSADGGETWGRVRQGLYTESAVRSLVVHPQDSRTMYAGAESGIYRSDNKGERWARLTDDRNSHLDLSYRSGGP